MSLKKLYVLLVVLFSQNIIFAQNYTPIPNLQFELALINLGLDDVQDYQVLTSSIDTVHTLDVSNQFIGDLTGIEDFALLTTLKCDSNNIPILNLTSNIYLTHLYCSSNNLITLDVSTNITLSHLDCSHNSLSSLNLSSSVSLSDLYCNDNQITSVDVSSSSNLVRINCNNNQLENLNIKNGNNVNITQFSCVNNSNLFCIDVDDPNQAIILWTVSNGNIDAWNNFNLDCSIAFGCLDPLACNYDSIASYNDSLTLGESSCIFPSFFTDDQVHCDSYTWIDGITYTSSNNTATHTLTNVAGCDSVVSLNLTINSSNTDTNVVSSCNSYTWDGVVYTTSGVYSNTYTNALGCDSVHTINLTINNSNIGTSSITACDSYSWDGAIYTTSGIYSNIYTNLEGCDSVHTLTLIINNSNTETSSFTVCDSYTWDGIVYTTSGTYSNTYTNLAGCDSIVTLNLTIDTATSSSTSYFLCDTTLLWNGVIYTLHQTPLI